MTMILTAKVKDVVAVLLQSARHRTAEDCREIPAPLDFWSSLFTILKKHFSPHSKKYCPISYMEQMGNKTPREVLRRERQSYPHDLKALIKPEVAPYE